MEKTENIVNALYEVISKNTNISKPFIVNDEGIGKIACFTYRQSSNNGEKYISVILSIYLIDCDTLDVKEFELEEDYSGLPIRINKISNSLSYNLKELQNEYYECIDNFFTKGKLDAEKFNQLFSAIEYDELRTVYKFFGAEFI